MDDLDTKLKIDILLDYSYDRTIERINAIEDAKYNVYQTWIAQKGNYKSFLMAYANYYCGCFEGIFFTRFLEEFNRMSSPSENAYITESTLQKFEILKKICLDLGDKKFNEYENL